MNLGEFKGNIVAARNAIRARGGVWSREDFEKTQPIVLTLPEPPSSNRMWRRGKTHTYVSEEARAYKEAVSMLASRYRNEKECAFPSGDLSITVLWHRSAKRGDLDNRIKVLLDALGGTIFRNDRQIAEIQARRVDAHPDLRKGFMQITIARLSAARAIFNAET